MFQKIICLWLMLLGLCAAASAQTGTAVISGTVRNNAGQPLDVVSVAISNTSLGTYTSPDGHYRLEVPAGRQLVVVYSYTGANRVTRTLSLSPGSERRLDVVLEVTGYQLGEFIKRDQRARGLGNLPMNVSEIQYMPDVTGGIEGAIKSMVGSNNELTSQYAVRGGNYDENLVYVNDFEIYRPFLVRSGQQEGLSFVNTDMVSNVAFSLGGFQARYGDKMSSVLDVSYRRPTQFRGSAMASLLGASLHLEGASKDTAFTWQLGLRQKSNQYLLQSQPTKGVYNPSFTDMQALLQYRINKHWDLEAIGNVAINRFSFYPEEQTSSFGVINRAFQLRVFYQGAEIDQFDSRFGGLSATWHNDRLRLKWLVSAFQTREQETYDIGGEYLLGELETDLSRANFGQIKTYLGTGIVQNYARNYLDVDVATAAHRGSYIPRGGRHHLLWGLDASQARINDRLHEWERRDSAGFTQPYNPELLEMKYLYSARATLDYGRFSAFLQDNFRPFDSIDLEVSAGARLSYTTLNQELIISPRLQVMLRPRWQRDIVLRAATGLYAQPPFYREMRSLEGNLNTGLKAQKSYHAVVGADYEFDWGGRPYKLMAEAYYKKLWDIVPYEYDNIRLRYFGQNNAVGYAYGGELRLFGDLVKDAPSWLSVGYMQTAEDLKDDQIVLRNTAGADSAVIYPGYVPRPTDQRLMFGMYFQDYLRRNRNFRMHLNLMYATGLPFGPPDRQRYGDTLRLPDYKRVDIGFSALLLDGARRERPAYSFFGRLESIWASLEVFNLLGIQNTLSYSWIQDQTSGRTFAVPNRLTSRLLNLKLIVKF